MTELEKADRGEQARRLLETPLLAEVLAALDATYVRAWRNAKTLEAREDAHRYAQLCKQFESDLKAVMKDGQVADHRIKELEGRKRFFG